MKIPAFAFLAIGIILLAGCTQNGQAIDRAGLGMPCGGALDIKCQGGLLCMKNQSSVTSYSCVPGRLDMPPQEKPGKNSTGLANPASVNCIDKGGKLSIENGADGGEVGYCTMPNGAKCEEWAFFRSGTCEKAKAPEGEFCGGIAAIKCPDGYECRLDGNYPDAGGKCAKIEIGKGMGNPSSLNCENKGGKIRIVKDAAGEYDMCTLPNGTECEVWDFYNTGKCANTIERADAKTAAWEFAKRAPTYAYDGSKLINGSIFTLPGGKYDIRLYFYSSNQGYGDRSGQERRNLSIMHVMAVNIEGDRITSAVTDGVYDEIGKRKVELAPLTKDSCEALGNKWNECASACRHDKNAQACTMQCVMTCECGNKACPSGYHCQRSDWGPSECMAGIYEYT